MRNCACSGDRLRRRLSGLEWRLIEDGAASGAWNMAVDEAMLEAARRDEAPPTLRFYRWHRPTLSLGRHQDPGERIDHAFRRRQDIDLARLPVRKPCETPCAADWSASSKRRSCLVGCR